MQNGQPVIVDYLEYAGLSADRSFGYAAPRAFDDAASLRPQPTPGAPNWDSPPPVAPEITNLELLADGKASLQWTAAPGQRYQLLAKDSLNDGAWQVVGEVTANGGETSLTDPAGAGKTQRFYRVLLLP
jgi:hypothetical protein